MAFFKTVVVVLGLASAILAGHHPYSRTHLGTLEHSHLPDFLTSNPLPHGFPWGRRKLQDSNPGTHTPHTGVTRYYDFTIARGIISSDGYEKNGILVNGQFPGPTIEANWGDTIQVAVHNNITGPEDGTAIHWHGIRQKGTQWYDGVPSISQCPIAPGSSFTYRFRADRYGTSWYHSHYSAQFTAGVYGPLIIYGPKHTLYDIDVGPVMLGDYYHRDYFDVLEDVTGSSPDFKVYVPTSDNNLINGKNNFNCSLAAANPNSICNPNAELSKFRFKSGKTHRLRLVNAGAAALVHFSIDGHSLQVITNDFTPIEPYEADVVTLGDGQRSDVLVKAIGEPAKAYWMRSTISLNCSVTQTTHSSAVILYDDADDSTQPNTTSSAAVIAADEKSNVCQNDDLKKTIPFFPLPATPNPDTTETVEIDLITNSTGHHVWILNNQTQRANYNNPVLLLAIERNFSSFDPEWNIYNLGSNKTIRIVMNNKYQSAHPMHLHGHDFAILSEGPSFWDGHTLTNPSNPLRRDTHMLRRFGHLVIQYTADNPGVWSYHCHIAWHSSMGFTMNLLERPGDIGARGGGLIPRVLGETCGAWERYSAGVVVGQIDSGI